MIKLENINTNEHNKIMKHNCTSYWCSNEHIKHNWRFNLYLYFFGDSVHENCHGSFHMPTDQGTF